MIHPQLLFFDTFSHDTSVTGGGQDLNLDLVQFPSPVYINEVRVIPLGAKVKANFPGGRMGATNPSKFDLELFVNNLRAPGASTFENIGLLQYNQAGCISLASQHEIATDGLVLRGLYSTITLAVYGTVSDCSPEELARQGAAAARQNTEDEPVELPHSGTQDNGRSLGEAYAAQWTEQHSQQALKAEPPDEDSWTAVKTNGSREIESSAPVRPERDNGSRFSENIRTSPPQRNRDRYSRERERDRSYDRISRERDRSFDRISRDRSRDRERSRDKIPRDIERTKDRERSFERSPELRSDRFRERRTGSKLHERSFSPRERRSVSRGRSRSPRERSHRSPSGSRDGERRGAERRPRTGKSPLSRDRSPYDYDKTSLNSSGSRRLLSPRSSPRRRSSLSPSPRYRKERSRSISGSRRSRSPRRRSPSAASRNQRTPERNGFKSPTPTKENIMSPVNEDILDAVSDISEGDIPDDPEPEEPDTNDDRDLGEEDSVTNRSSIAKEDVEEISDEEAEWSDDFDTGCYSDLDTVEIGEDWEDPVIYFDPVEADLAPLTILSDPTETLYDRVASNKLLPGRSDKALELLVANLDNPVFDEKFIENIEHLTKTVQVELPKVTSQHLIEKLVKIGLSSIDFDAAMSQIKPPSKLRQLKSGLKLMMELLGCRGSLILKLLQSKVQVKLLSLYGRDHMAMSLKLLILRVLDVSLNTLEGIEQFSHQNLYNKLLELSTSSQSSRTQFSLSSILTKLHLSEQLEHFSSVMSCDEISEASGQVISHLLDNLKEVYLDITLRMSHPPRFLPSQLHFDLSEKEFGSPKSSYFSLMSAYGLLELLSCLLTSPSTSEQEELMVSVQQLLSTWMTDEEGLLFMANNPELTNVIVRTLIGCKQDEKQPEEEKKECNEDQEGPTSSSVLGVELCHHVMAVQYLDIITKDVTSAAGVRLDMETEEVHNAISSLYGMTFSPKGREAVVDVVTMGDHLSPLLSLTKHTSEDRKKDMKKSAIRGFASELILLIVRSSDNIPFLQRFSTQLLTTGSSDSHSKLAELQAWCSPLSDPTVFTEAGIGQLISLARRKVEESEEQKEQSSAELVTTVRLLRHLAAPRTIARMSGEREMKYKYAAIAMFSGDLVPLYTQLLDKISRDHEQPHLHTATFIGQRGFTILSILQPVVSTLLVLLEMVISCRDTEFKDLSVVSPLLKTFTLLSIVPSSSSYQQAAKTTSADLVQCLLAFTKPNVDLNKTNVSKSLWTQMLSELLSYTSSMPCLLMPGLSLLSQLLPLPLPIPSTRSLARQEAEAVSTSRKLWSAHLHPLSSQLANIICQAASCSFPPLLCLAQRVADQLSSLSPPTALLVVTAVVQGIKELAGPPLARMFQFLAWCVAQPALKTVLVDKMSHDIAFRASVLSQLDLGLGGIEGCPESCVLVVQRLCDPAISMSTSDSQEVVLADSLPNKDTLLSLVSCLLEHLASESKNLTSQTAALKVLMMLTDHEVTSSILKLSLVSSSVEKEKSLFCFLRKVAVEFSATDPDIERLVSALLSSLARLTGLLSLTELGLGLGWTSAEDSSQEAVERRRTHPLVVLSNRIREAERDQSDLELTNIGVKCSELVSLLETMPPTVLPDPVVPTDLLTPSLPEARSPLELWTGRDLAVTCGEISSDQLSMVYWLSSDSGDKQEFQSEAQQSLVTVDLLAVNQKYLSSLDLLSAAKEVTRERTLATDRKKKGVKKSLMETKVLQNKNIISAFKDGKNVTLRGRGFARTAFKTDPFRTRPPNTSRPPSLHVDDFLVLEMKGQQPTGPTGYNKQSVKAAKELFALREAEAALKPPSMMREATREPVGLSRGRGRPERGAERGGRSFRGGGAGNSRNFRRDSRGWSPTSSTEPRDLGREARPARPEDRRPLGGRGGSYRGDRRGGSGGGGRGERKFGRAGGGRR